LLAVVLEVLEPQVVEVRVGIKLELNLLLLALHIR
jgi:hypothetical protein